MVETNVVENQDSDVSSQIFITRQPVFSRSLKVHGFELIYRAADGGLPEDSSEHSLSTTRAIANAFLKIGADKLLNNKPAFISFDESMLSQGLAGLLPLQSVVVEVPSSVEPTPKVLETCGALKKQGYLLAVSARPEGNSIELWLPMTDIVKVDFMTVGPDERASYCDKYRNGKRMFYAGAVQTEAEFEVAAQQGYDLFQGPFLAAPTVVKGHSIAHRQLTLVRILTEVSKFEMDLDNIERLIRQDVSLTYQLLQYMNSAAFAWRTTIKSVRHAVALLGEEELRKWTCLLLIAGLSSGRPPALLVKSLAWARFGELLAPRLRMGNRKASAFLLGLFANLDVILKCPMAEAIEVLNLEPEIRDALLGVENENRMRYLLMLIRAYDSGDWVRLVSLSEYLNLNLENIAKDYVKAVEWAEMVAAV